MATSGPGWGGTRPCRMDRPAKAGMPTRIKGTSVRRATRMTTGTSSTTPTSKNRGSPRMAAINAIAQGSPRLPTLPMMVSTMVSAPPESASSAPNIAPRPISRPTAPTVPPNPVVKLVMMSSGATPATIPMTAVPSIRARNGCIFTHTISTTTAAMPKTAASTIWALPASVSFGGSSTNGSRCGRPVIVAVIRALMWCSLHDFASPRLSSVGLLSREVEGPARPGSGR